MTRLRALAVATGGLMTVSLLAVLGAASPAAAATGCSAPGPGQVRFTWTGGSGAWNDAGNWTLDGAQTGHRAPTYFGADPTTDDSLRGLVCVAPVSPAVITLDDSSHVHVQALEVFNATLVATGARVMVYGPAGTHTSTIHPDATVRLHASTLGGPGRIDVEGHVFWGEAGFGVGTLDNDHCADFPMDQAVDACPVAAPATGTLRVASGGLLEVVGRGVNLSDGYAVDVASGGRLLLTGAGYVAADRDTAITVQPGGTLELAGDASVFEGKSNGQADPDLAELTNDGTVLKSAGGGASALNVNYAGSGRVDVRTGGLSISGTAPITGDLRAGARLGTASCGVPGVATDAARPCLPAATAEDPQIAVLSPQQPVSGVVVQEGAVPAQTGDLQPAVSIASPAVPSTLYLELQDQRPAAELTVFRTRSGLQQRIPLCGAGGALPAGVTACIVGRRGSGGRAQLEVVTSDPDGLWSLRPSAVDFVRLVDPLVGAREGCAVSQPTYPFVAREQIRLLQAGSYALYFATTENAPAGAPVATGVAGPGLTQVPIRVTRNGWVAVVATGVNGQPESTGSFRVVATPAIAFRKRSRAAVAGRPFVIEGRVRPKGRRTVDLYAVRVTGSSGFLARTKVHVRTDRKGRFRVVHRPKRAGRWVYAVQVRGKGALSTAMSRQAVRVSVRAPAPAPAPTVVRNVRAAETTATAPSAPAPGTAPPVDPLDLIGPFYPGRVQRAAAACRFQVAR
ncbi:hypothetical protein [Nocardioides sp. SLBN-35]|uniref:hypothetical protein n=1 Tax=Nocardioides sp. SLBN-35 TaxID=2768445 RepID=UPI0011523A07|nr:hypothetical protein [Nocardioides sp. SLBN-35]TQK72664.1 hypothetical protein FBY23_4481 [Nocardioides sp. SLBN-35]